MPQPMFRLNAMGPVGLTTPDCIMTTPGISGKALQAAAAAAMLLTPQKMQVGFWGWTGADEVASLIRRALMPIPIDLTYFRRYPGPSVKPTTAAEVVPAASQYLLERITDAKDWPEEPCYQCSWLLIESPQGESAKPLLIEWLRKAKRRGCLTALWMSAPQAEFYLSEKIETFCWDAIDLLIIEHGASQHDFTSRLEAAKAWGLTSVLELTKTSLVIQSTGGVFGRVEAVWPWPAFMTLIATEPITAIEFCDNDFESDSMQFRNAALIGSFFAFLFAEIHSEDQFDLVDVHLDKSFLVERPLHLGKAINWAFCALQSAHFTAEGLTSETNSGSWLHSTQIAWKQAYPEAFKLW